MRAQPTTCYVDESIHISCGFVATALVFATRSLEGAVAAELRSAGLVPGKDEFKSRSRMDRNPRMREVRDRLIALAGSRARVAVVFGPFDRRTVGKQSLQALQSTLVRNGIRPSRVRVYFDRGIFQSAKDATRLHRLFSFLQACKIHPEEDSCIRLGIQVADAVAHSFAQVLKEKLTGRVKEVDIGGPGTGYPDGLKAPLGWSLLMSLRNALMTRPVIQGGGRYSAATDPVVLDPEFDDPVTYGQHPVLLGWGIQVAPEAADPLRQGVEQGFGKIWLGCIH